MCHLFGGLTPMNIWDMAYADFRVLAGEADAYAEETKKQSK